MSDLRVVLHCRSTWSYDGHWTLAAIARFYGTLGVDAVTMTEHDTGFDPTTLGQDFHRLNQLYPLTMRVETDAADEAALRRGLRNFRNRVLGRR